MTDKDKARRTRMRFEIETAISNGGSAEDLEKAVDRIIAIHEANKPKPEPFIYLKPDPFGWMVCSKDDECVIALYTTPPTREPLSEKQRQQVIKKTRKEFPLMTDYSILHILEITELAHGIGVTND